MRCGWGVVVGWLGSPCGHNGQCEVLRTGISHNALGQSPTMPPKVDAWGWLNDVWEPQILWVFAAEKMSGIRVGPI